MKNTKNITRKKLLSHLFMAGYPDEIFMPDESITRAEVTVMFSRLITEKMDSNKDYSSSFPDVSEDNWYAPQLGFMEQYGIIEAFYSEEFPVLQDNLYILLLSAIFLFYRVLPYLYITSNIL